MAGLPEYIGMGGAVALVYIGIKYGPQIIKNLQQNQSNPQGQTPQTNDNQTSTAPTTSEGPDTDVAPTTGTTVHTNHRINCGPGMMINKSGICVANPDLPYTPPRHQNDTGTLQHSSQNKARHMTQPPLPSGAKDQGTAPIVHKRRYVNPHSANKNCICTTEGVWKGYPGQTCSVTGQKCTPSASAYLGYFDSYNIAVPGPQWRKTIPNNQYVASAGMVQGRVRRAVAAGNHNFMPGGFVLSEASVRRGVNNVYSAGT